MRYLFLLLLYSFSSFSLLAQSKNDLWVTAGDDGWSIVHKVQPGETIFSLSRQFHVPPAILADANGLSYQDGLKASGTVKIPLGAYNFQSTRPLNTGESKALYYRVRDQDNLYRISRLANVSQRTLQEWNQLPDNTVSPGQALLVGWVLYDITHVNALPGAPQPPGTYVSGNRVPGSGLQSSAGGQSPRPAPAAPKVVYDTPKYVMHVPSPDTVVATPDSKPVPPANSLEAEYNSQTLEGKNLVTERGAAAFYALTGPTKGAAAYAFHNSAARGAVIRVKNVNNGRYVFVKVIGPVPTTKQYYNCIIGLSNAAKAALGVRDSKAFCELTYGGY